MKTVMVYISFLLIGIISCDTTEPPPPPDDKPTLTLELDDAQCTEVWINFTTTKLQLPDSIILKQFNPGGDSLSTTINLTTSDSLVYIDSLLPNANYTFQASSIQHQVSSNELSVTTMDTTSHNFTWQMFTFGEHSSSVLNDVAIIDQNNIWAVGAIYMNDSLGNADPKPYGIAKWDGQMWGLKKLFYNNNLIVAPIRGILVLNPNDIYLAAGSVFHWDGVSSQVQLVYSRLNLPDPNGTIEKLWGHSATAIYGVGNAGSLIFYNGQIWSQVESGTELNINDIWGDFNQKTQQWEILAVCGNILHGSEYERAVLQITNGNQVHQVSAEGANWPLRTVWFLPPRKYYVAGSGIYEKRLLNQDEWENDIFEITTYSINRLRGKFINDVVAAGGGGEVLHFNGITWKSYINEAGLNYGNYYSIAIKDNLIAVVGVDAPSAAITIGRR